MLKLCNPKSKILKKTNDKSPSFDNPNELISVNYDFKNDNMKVILIPVMSPAKIVAQNEQNNIFNEMAVEI